MKRPIAELARPEIPLSGAFPSLNPSISISMSTAIINPTSLDRFVRMPSQVLADISPIPLAAHVTLLASSIKQDGNLDAHMLKLVNSTHISTHNYIIPPPAQSHLTLLPTPYSRLLSLGRNVAELGEVGSVSRLIPSPHQCHELSALDLLKCWSVSVIAPGYPVFLFPLQLHELPDCLLI